MASMNKLPSNNTAIYPDSDGMTRVILHNTCVVAFNDTRIELDTGGWDTATTRARMNQASNQYGLGFKVHRDKGQTYVENKVGRIPLDRKATIDRLHYANT